MQKRILAVAIALALIMVLALPMGVSAANTGIVTCTVTGVLVSVTVSDGNVAYGNVELGEEEDTTGSGVNETQTATNNGTVDEDFSIKSSDADGTVDWTLAATRAANQFFHNFSINGGTLWTPMDDEGVALANSVAAAGTQPFDLQIGMPTSVTDYTQHTIIVTITATQSGS